MLKLPLTITVQQLVEALQYTAAANTETEGDARTMDGWRSTSVRSIILQQTATGALAFFTPGHHMLIVYQTRRFLAVYRIIMALSVRAPSQVLLLRRNNRQFSG